MLKSLTEALHLVEPSLTDRTLTSAIISGPRRPGTQAYARVVIKPITLRGSYLHQLAFYSRDKVKHENLAVPEALQAIRGLLETEFKQANLFTETADIQLLVNAQGQVHTTQKPATKSSLKPSAKSSAKSAPLPPHNRIKNHILPEGLPCDFLVSLGLMTADGTVVAAKYDKFRQVNRFLEMVEDVVGALPQGLPIHVVDFGCGKAFLTFALYYYLRTLKNMDAHLIGLDLKADVIENNRRLAESLGYDQITFQVGDIQTFVPEAGRIDMSVSLHACDTATDEVLGQAVRWGASVILASPCCQHELYGQIENTLMVPLTKHGIIRERLASLVTDAARANLLEICHYSVQMLEFIAVEHTPKNILLRAVRQAPRDQSRRTEEYAAFRDFWHIHPRLETVLSEAGLLEETLHSRAREKDNSPLFVRPSPEALTNETGRV